MSFTSAGDTGGEYKHTLSTSEMPKHDHPLPYASSSSAPSTNYTYALLNTAGTNSSSGKGWNGNMGTHTVGGGDSHNNIQPYITVYFWRRTA